MFDFLRAWYRRQFSDPQVVILVIFLIALFSVILLLGDILAPLLIAVVLAYLLDGVVTLMERWRIPRVLASSVVLLSFLVFCLILLLGLAPLLSKQLADFVREVPGMIASVRTYLLQLPQAYPQLVTEAQIEELFTSLRSEIANFGQVVLSISLAHAVGVFTVIVYVILIPLLVFFALKDKKKVMAWATAFLPKDRQLSFRVWREVDSKIANYIRGKFIEILIVWLATYVPMAVMGLNYALLLSFLVGISVIIPFVGAIVVTVPVALVAFFQWGLDPTFWYLMLAYLVVQMLDGNLLVPILFSEVVNLHPIAIIAAVLFFGGLWGVWGIFFAIPLATLVQAVINAWPHAEEGNPTPAEPSVSG